MRDPPGHGAASPRAGLAALAAGLLSGLNECKGDNVGRTAVWGRRGARDRKEAITVMLIPAKSLRTVVGSLSRERSRYWPSHSFSFITDGRTYWKANLVQSTSLELLWFYSHELSPLRKGLTTFRLSPGSSKLLVQAGGREEGPMFQVSEKETWVGFRGPCRWPSLSCSLLPGLLSTSAFILCLLAEALSSSKLFSRALMIPPFESSGIPKCGISSGHRTLSEQMNKDWTEAAQSLREVCGPVAGTGSKTRVTVSTVSGLLAVGHSGRSGKDWGGGGKAALEGGILATGEEP